MLKVAAMIAREIELGTIDPARLHGCSPQEIAEVEAVAGFPLPAEYRAFLEIMGKSENTLKVFAGSDIYYPHPLTLHEGITYFFSIDWKIEPTIPEQAFFSLRTRVISGITSCQERMTPWCTGLRMGG